MPIGSRRRTRIGARAAAFDGGRRGERGKPETEAIRPVVAEIGPKRSEGASEWQGQEERFRISR